jgi:hypothetical protein
MNWEDKFKIVSSCLATHEEIEQDFYIKDIGASNAAISLIRQKYIFLPQDYFDFLQVTDGADIAQCRFFGSAEYISASEIYTEVYPKEAWYVFGAESGGDPLLIDCAGKVAIGVGKSYSGEFTLLANSFSDFLSEIIMGPKYPMIFGIKESGFSDFVKEEEKEDPWLAFLIERKWLTV